MSSITPRIWKIFLLPIKKTIATASGIILEEDIGEVITDIYEVMFNIEIDSTTALMMHDRVICSDAVGTNVVVNNQMIKVVEASDILGFIS